MTDPLTDTPITKNPEEIEAGKEPLALIAFRRDRNAGGAPKKWNNPQELLDAAQEYIEKAVERSEHITLSGMAIWIGTTRETLLNYSRENHVNGDDTGFADAMKRIRQVCENYSERHGYTARNPAMAIFALKQHGWKDTQTIETTTTEVHTIDPETRKLVSEYVRQLAESQKHPVIDVTPGPVRVLGIGLGIREQGAANIGKENP